MIKWENKDVVHIVRKGIDFQLYFQQIYKRYLNTRRDALPINNAIDAHLKLLITQAWTEKKKRRESGCIIFPDMVILTPYLDQTITIKNLT